VLGASMAPSLRHAARDGGGVECVRQVHRTTRTFRAQSFAGIDISAPVGRVSSSPRVSRFRVGGKAWADGQVHAFRRQLHSANWSGCRPTVTSEDAVLHGIDFTDIGGGLRPRRRSRRDDPGNVFLRNTVGARRAGLHRVLRQVAARCLQEGCESGFERTGASTDGTERLDLAKKDWGGFVNHASGRGDSADEQVRPHDECVFLSPPASWRSRPQTVYDLVKSDPA